jgi:hypothetical protein
VINSNQKFCLQSDPTIANINTDGQNLQWFKSLTSLNPLASSTILTDDKTYYYAFTNNGCLGSRTPFLVSLKDIAPPTGNRTQNFCSSDNPKIANLTVRENSVSWYISKIGGIPLDSTTLLNSNTIYYASQTDSQTGCESSVRLPVKAVINDNSANLPKDYN